MIELIPQELGSKAYTDRQIYLLEEKEVFQKNWLYACPSSWLGDIGAFYEFNFMKESVIILRDSESKLRAFHNVCQHRGHRLIQGYGNAKCLVCPYHSLRYDLAGKPLSWPSVPSLKRQHMSRLQLLPIQVEVFLDKFVFVNLDLHAASMRSLYLGVEEDIEKEIPLFNALSCATPARLNPESEAFVEDRIINANWKVVIENCLECFHCRTVHPAFARLINLDTMKVATGKRWSSMKGGLKEPSKVPKSAPNRVYKVWWMWPNTYLEMGPGGPHSIAIGSQYPLSVDMTVQGPHHRFVVPGRPEYEPRGYGDLNLLAEDAHAIESVQKGHYSTGFTRGALLLDDEFSALNEGPLCQFQSLVIESLDGVQT